MNKIDSTENRFDVNIGGIFGEFSLPGLEQDKDTTTTTDPNEPDAVQKLTDDVVKNLIGTEDDDTDDTEEITKEDSVEGGEDEEGDQTSEDDKQDSDDADNSGSDDSGDVEYSYKAIAQYLAEQGIIDYEDSEDIEDSPDVLENVVLQTAKNMVSEYKDSIPSEAKDFLNYLEKGGDPSKYIQTVNTPIDFENVDLTSEDNQKAVLREFLKTLDYSKEEIEEEIMDYEDALILEKKAQTAVKKLAKIHSDKKKELLAAQEQAELDAKKQYEESLNHIKQTISTATSLGGLAVGPNDKKEFEKYLLHRDQEGLTQYEREIQENPVQTQLELAYLKFKKYNFSKIANKVKTEETRRIKNLIKTKDNTVRGKSKQVSKTGDDISAFRNIGL